MHMYYHYSVPSRLKTDLNQPEITLTNGCEYSLDVLVDLAQYPYHFIRYLVLKKTDMTILKHNQWAHFDAHSFWQYDLDRLL